MTGKAESDSGSSTWTPADLGENPSRLEERIWAEPGGLVFTGVE